MATKSVKTLKQTPLTDEQREEIRRRGMDRVEKMIASRNERAAQNKEHRAKLVAGIDAAYASMEKLRADREVSWLRINQYVKRDTVGYWNCLATYSRRLFAEQNAVENYRNVYLDLVYHDAIYDRETGLVKEEEADRMRGGDGTNVTDLTQRMKEGQV